MALFTLYYELDETDTCDSRLQKKELTLQRMAELVKREIRFEKHIVGDEKRFKANVTIMNDKCTDDVIDVLRKLDKVVDYPEKKMISKVLSLIVGLPFDSPGGFADYLGMAEPIPGHTTDIMIEAAKEIQHGIDETFVHTSPIQIRKRSLDELMDILPDEIDYLDGDANPGRISFALTKDKTIDKKTKYTCAAFWVDLAHDDGEGVFINGSGGENLDDALEFIADDPSSAVSMMIGHLKYNKLI